MTRMQEKSIEIGLLVLGSILVLFLFHHGIGGDGTFRYLSIEKLFEEGTIVSTKYSMVGPLFSAPLYALGYLIKSGFWWVKQFNAVIFVLALWFFYRHFRASWGESFTRKFLLLLICASMFGKHLEEFYGEVFTALTAGIGLALLAMGAFRRGTVVLILSAMNSPATIAGLGVAAVFLFFRERRAKFLCVPVLALLGVLAENWIRRGTPLDMGYASEAGAAMPSLLPFAMQPGFTYPFLFGLLSLTLSFGKGIFFFAPGVLFLGFRGKKYTDRDCVLYVWVAYTVGLLCLYANWWCWHGDRFWGPRYLLFAAILACFLLAEQLETQVLKGWRPLLVVLAVGLSVWVGASGVVFGQAQLDSLCGQHQFICWYIPEYSPLLRPFVEHSPLSWNDLATLVFFGGFFFYLTRAYWGVFFKNLRGPWPRELRSWVRSQRWRV